MVKSGAAVVSLAFLGGLAAIVGALSAVHALRDGYSAGFADLYTVMPRGWLRGYYWLAAVFDPSAALLLIVGAILLIVRRGPGQILVMAGCALVIVLGVFGAVVKPDLLGTGPAGFMDHMIRLALLGFPIVTIALAKPRLTRRPV